MFGAAPATELFVLQCYSEFRVQHATVRVTALGLQTSNAVIKSALILPL